MNRYLRAFLWAMSQKRTGKLDLAKAKKCIDIIEKRTKLTTLELAHKGTILMMMERFDEAGDYFALAVSEEKILSNPTREYISLYSKFMLHTLRGEKDQAEEAKSRALSVNCKDSLRIVLPL